MPTLRPATPVRILVAAADHVERVGLYQGEHPWKPGRMGDTAPCTVLYAWERGVRAVRPHWSVRGAPWTGFRRAHVESLVVLSDYLNGRPISEGRWIQLRMTEDAYRRTVLWCWGDESGRTANEAAAAIRAAALMCDARHETAD